MLLSQEGIKVQTRNPFPHRKRLGCRKDPHPNRRGRRTNTKKYFLLDVLTPRMERVEKGNVIINYIKKSWNSIFEIINSSSSYPFFVIQLKLIITIFVTRLKLIIENLISSSSYSIDQEHPATPCWFRILTQNSHI